MSQPIDPAESWPPGVAARINPVCDRFEKALQTDGRPRLEEFLPQAEDLPWLLRELLHLEVNYRRLLGEEPTAAEYRLRFPEYADLIDGVFGGFSTNRPAEPSAPVEGGTVTHNGSSATAPPVPPPTPPVLPCVPGYEILGELEHGAMGVVYKARQLGFNRIVALKMILSGAHAGDEERERFRIEAEAVARLQHTNIVPVYEVGEHEGKPFFSMEFCPGGGLDKKLNGTPLPPKEAAQLVETLARAMQAAHDKKVIHRDLKPANVLLAEDGTPKVSDFGLAKRMDAARLTLPGVAMGTPSYMPPEQATPEEADGKPKEIGPAADTYALGAILYECLTGRPPFRAATVYETMLQVVSDDPVPPRQLQPKTPRDLETICLKCLAKEPAKRYGSAEALAEDLGRYLAGEPVRARPAGVGERAVKWVRRRPAVAGLLALFILSLLGGTAVSLYFAVADSNALSIVTAREKQLNEANTHLNDANTQVNETNKRLVETLADKKRQLSVSARIAAGRSDAEYRAGNLRDSLNWMLQAYELAPSEDSLRPSYVRLIRGRGRGLSDRALWHDGPVSSASLSPDGRTVVTASGDRTARLWDAASGQELQRLKHDAGVNAASFSPDGRTVLTASWDKTARLWDAATGNELQRLPHEKAVHAASFSPDGRTVATASDDHTARLWDAASGKELQRLSHEDTVWSASFSPDGRTVVTASADGTARLWDVASGKEMQRLTHEPMLAVVEASFSPDGRTVVTASLDNTARLWDAASGKELQRLTHEKAVIAASFSPDGRTVVTASWDHTARLWDAATGTEWRRLTHVDQVWSASFSPDGRTVVTASNDNAARLWDASGKKLQQLTCDGPVHAALFSPDGRTVVTASMDHTARLWDAASGKELQRLTHNGEVNAASFSPDGRTVVTASLDNTAGLWDAASGKQLQRLTHAEGVLAASFSPDSRTVVTAGMDNTARLWDAASGKELQRLTHGDMVFAASFSPDGRTVVTASADKTAGLWDAASGKELQRLTHKEAVIAASFSPDGRTVVTASEDYTARLWDAASGKELQRLTHGDYVRAASFSPDGRMVLTASNDHTARLWDAASGKELQRLTHEDVVWSASFSPDGRTVLTASQDKTARLWDAASGKELQRLTHDADVQSASFSPDGRTVVTASADKTARLWDAASGEELQRLTHKEAVIAASFSPDGRTVLTASHDKTDSYDKTARLWDIGFLSAPAEVDPDRLRAWVLVRTGQDFTEKGVLHLLNREEWQQHQTLDPKGGDWKPTPDLRQWHLAQAAEAEADEAWFAARFHLNRLLLTDPNNADLLRRRDEAAAHLPTP